jgi:hypothetical protein
MEHEEADTFAGLLPADEVPAVVAELTPLDRNWLRARIVEDDLEYVTEALAGLREFLDRAAHQHAAVVFTSRGKHAVDRVNAWPARPARRSGKVA